MNVARAGPSRSPRRVGAERLAGAAAVRPVGGLQQLARAATVAGYPACGALGRGWDLAIDGPLRRNGVPGAGPRRLRAQLLEADGEARLRRDLPAPAISEHAARA